MLVIAVCRWRGWIVHRFRGIADDTAGKWISSNHAILAEIHRDGPSNQTVFALTEVL